MNPSAPGSADRHHLAARFVDGPHVAASDNAEQRLTDWLAELEPAQSAALDELLDRPLRQAHPARHRRILAVPVRPDARRSGAADPAAGMRPGAASRRADRNDSREVFAAPDETEVMHLLRRMKAEAALLIALCDIGGVWPVMRVTAALTDLAVASVQIGACASCCGRRSRGAGCARPIPTGRRRLAA